MFLVITGNVALAQSLAEANGWWIGSGSNTENYTNLLNSMEVNNGDLVNKNMSFRDAGGADRFLTSDWAEGGSLTSEHMVIRPNKYQFNYDFYKNVLYAKSGDSVIMVNSKNLLSFYIKGKDRQHTYYRFPAIGSPDFQELLSSDPHENKLRLVKQRRITFEKFDKPNANTALTGDISDKYRNVFIYFLISPDGTVTETSLNANLL